MKRSEMIQLIADQLHRILPAELCKYAIGEAGTILYTMESNGMVPPKITSVTSYGRVCSAHIWEEEFDEE